MSWLDALILGIVQGLTEFLPISSDGHLAVTQKLLAWRSGHSQTGAENLFYIVMVHLGTLAAIIIYYRKVWIEAIRGLLGATNVAPGYDRASVIRTGLLAIVATIPAVIFVLFLKNMIEDTFESLEAAGVGFLITACILLVTARQKGGDKGPTKMTWLDALLIGIAQMFAPLPGVSRSGLTITTGLARKLNREWAVGFSLLMAVPAIGGAGVLELRKVTRAMLAPSFLGPTLLAVIVAGLVGYGAIAWLVRLARLGRLWYFSVYLLVMGIAVLIAARWGF